MAERPRPDLDQTREALRRRDEQADEAEPTTDEPAADEPAADEPDEEDEEEPGTAP